MGVTKPYKFIGFGANGCHQTLASKRVDLISNKLNLPSIPSKAPGGDVFRLVFRLARLCNRSRVPGENPKVSGQAPIS